ncbi:unnamed protein product [Dovyalis caffra]|uniref:Disease resistance N-terminal domain-containing protein n=1 Tax=Dovyalis caffra TaxID=77055 RepID=A0AAV1R9R3_9ROSI|nr:unnamed protein product [Dovyalis caffra]
MADLFLSPALQVIFDRITSPFIEVLGGIWGFEDNLKRRKQSLLMIQAALEDAEEQQVTRKALKAWTCSGMQLIDYHTEDLLEHLTVEGKRYPVGISMNGEKVRKALETL